MAEQGAIPVIVLAPHQDGVEAINATLRTAGHAVRCSWVHDVNGLGEALANGKPDLLLAFVGTKPEEMTSVMNVRNQAGAKVPVVFVCEGVTEDVIATAMQQGAQDVVSLQHKLRLQAVVTRELEAHWVARRLQRATLVAGQYRDQLKAVMTGTDDAIAHVQEGIVVDANPAWVALYGLRNVDAVVGQPLMDSFDPQAHPALKSALAGCLSGKTPTQPLRLDALVGDKVSPLDLEISRAEYEGEPAVRLRIADRRQKAAPAAAAPAIAAPAMAAPTTAAPPPKASPELDATTGLLQRQHFIEHLKTMLAQQLKAGIRQLLCIEADKFRSIAENIGPLLIEQFMGQLAALLKDQKQASDLAGRFGESALMVLIERGTPREVEAWANGLISKVAGTVLRVGEKSLSCTLSIGISMVEPRPTDITEPIRDAMEALRKAQEAGGNRLLLIDHTDADTQRNLNDKIWVQYIKSALMENRFRLMQQPIASLMGDDRGMFDVLVRMVDEHGQEVLPSQFMPIAERNDLMKNIDRWIIGASMSVCASRPVKRLFVRLSHDSVRDKSLPQWLNNQLKATRIDPRRIAFQVSEQIANEYLLEASELAKTLRTHGFQFALEHFGTGRDPEHLLSHLPIDYIKIDGTLVEGLAVNPTMQERIRDLVERARGKSIATIAERVADANTMAVLWQLGVEFIQGYFVNEPEEVVLG